MALSPRQRGAMFAKKSGSIGGVPKLGAVGMKAPKKPGLGGSLGMGGSRFGESQATPSPNPKPPSLSMKSSSGVPGVPSLSTANRKSTSRFGF